MCFYHGGGVATAVLVAGVSIDGCHDDGIVVVAGGVDSLLIY